MKGLKICNFKFHIYGRWGFMIIADNTVILPAGRIFSTDLTRVDISDIFKRAIWFVVQ